MDFYPLNRTPEQVAQESIIYPGIIKDAFKGIGVFAVSVTLFTSFSVHDDQISRFESVQKICPTPDKEFNIVSANTRYNPGFASDLIEETSAELGVFQETRRDDIQEIVDDVSGSSAIFAPSDYAVDWAEGGLGNTTVTAGPKTTEKMRSIKGDMDIKKFLGSLIRLDSQGMSDAYKERRSALNTRLEVEIDGQRVGLNIMNIHVSGGEIGDEQLEDVIDFANEEMDAKNEINLMIGDFNKTAVELAPFLTNVKKGWIISEIGPTSRDNNRQIDHVIYSPFVKISNKFFIVVINPTVLPKKGSDHRAINTTIHLREFSPELHIKKFLETLNNQIPEKIEVL